MFKLTTHYGFHELFLKYVFSGHFFLPYYFVVLCVDTYPKITEYEQNYTATFKHIDLEGSEKDRNRT